MHKGFLTVPLIYVKYTKSILLEGPNIMRLSPVIPSDDLHKVGLKVPDMCPAVEPVLRLNMLAIKALHHIEETFFYHKESPRHSQFFSKPGIFV